MRVLTHGATFFCFGDMLERYRGPHEIRELGTNPEAYYRYDPVREPMPALYERIAAEWQPDLILCWFPEEHPPPLCIEESPVPVAAMVGDWDVHFPKLEVNLARFDVVLCDKEGVGVLDSEWVKPRYLFPLYSYRSAIHHPYPAGKDLDAVFVGTVNPSRHFRRMQILEKIARMSDRYRILITTGPTGEAYAQLLSRARIVVNYAARHELNLRVLETMACGSLAFEHESKTEIHDWFRDGDALVFYNDANVEEKIEYYLAHPAEAAAIVKRGQEQCAAFAGENRLTALIDFVAACPSSGRRFRELPRIEQDYQTALLFQCKAEPAYSAAQSAHLERCVDAYPGDARFWSALADQCTLLAGRTADPQAEWKRCLAHYRRACRLDPESAPYALSAGMACEQAGLLDDAAQYYGAATRAPSIRGAALLTVAPAAVFWGRWQAALAARTASVAMIQAEAHIRLAHVVCLLGAPQNAEPHLAEARELDPANLNGVRLEAEIQWANHRQDEAVATLMRHLQEMPLDLDVRKRLCVMLDTLGRAEEARALAEDTLLIARAYKPQT